MSLMTRLRDWLRPGGMRGGGGFLNTSLDDALKSEFFVWFQLEEVARASLDGGRTRVSFKPAGEKFHDLVVVEVTLDRRGLIAAVSLLLGRSFIDHPNDGIFARDIAKSLLRTAPPDPDRDAAAELANEIEYKHDYQIIVGPGYQPPPLPPDPTPGLQTYLGRRESYEMTFSRSTLRLEQARDREGAWLRMSLRAK